MRPGIYSAPPDPASLERFLLHSSPDDSLGPHLAAIRYAMTVCAQTKKLALKNAAKLYQRRAGGLNKERRNASADAHGESMK